MIDEVLISGLGVIETAHLRLSSGLTVVTGETGAGKTMIVTALTQLLGARADTALVRAGEPEARIEARFAPAPPAAAAWLGDGTDDAELDELIVSREIPREGRSRARINGRLAPVSALAEVLGAIVDVHAQHEHLRLSRPEVQRDLLDRYAGDPHARVLEGYRRAYAAWRELEAEASRRDDDARERVRERERLAYEVAEIERAGLDPDRDGRIDEVLDVLAHAEELQLAIAEAAAGLGEDGAAGPLGLAVDALRRPEVSDPRLAELRGRLEAVTVDAQELVTDLRDYAESVEADPQRLEELRERRIDLVALQRKYGSDIDEVIAYAERAGAELAEMDAREAAASDLDERRTAAGARVVELAADVTRGRDIAAERLAAAVNDHLAELAMPQARFRVALDAPEDAEPGPHGGDRIAFLLAANPGEPEGPVSRAASGGERSRVALAIEVALADVDEAEVLVFDEVDAGIGGATAMAVGAKLARLAAGGRQVLCVTHLAQLAAFADVHHVVDKAVRDGRTVTTTRRVADDERVAELARMLSGDLGGEAGLEHARELLERAERRHAG